MEKSIKKLTVFILSFSIIGFIVAAVFKILEVTSWLGDVENDYFMWFYPIAYFIFGVITIASIWILKNLK